MGEGDRRGSVGAYTVVRFPLAHANVGMGAGGTGVQQSNCQFFEIGRAHF